MNLDRINKLTDELNKEIEAQVRSEVAARILGSDAMVEKTRVPVPSTTNLAPLAKVQPKPAQKKPAVAKEGGAKRYGIATDEILAFVKASGAKGTNAETIRVHFEASNGAISRQLKKLLDDKKIKKTGKLRATRYFAK